MIFINYDSIEKTMKVIDPVLIIHSENKRDLYAPL